MILPSYHNPNSVKMYVEAKAEDIRNPKNPLSQREGPSPLLVIFFIVLIVGLYLFYQTITFTYTSFDNAKSNTDFQEVYFVERDHKIYTTTLTNQHYTTSEDHFFIECTSDKILDLYYTISAVNNDITLEMMHNYAKDSQVLTFTTLGMDYEDIYMDLKDDSSSPTLLEEMFKVYTSSSIDYTVYDQLFNEYSTTYEFGTFNTLSRDYVIDENTIQKCTLSFEPYQNTVKSILTYEFIKK